LDTEGERENINENDILSSNFTRENTTLDAAPWAVTSSGLIPLEGSLPPKYSLKELFSKDGLSCS